MNKQLDIAIKRFEGVQVRGQVRGADDKYYRAAFENLLLTTAHELQNQKKALQNLREEQKVTFYL